MGISTEVIIRLHSLRTLLLAEQREYAEILAAIIELLRNEYPSIQWGDVAQSLLACERTSLLSWFLAALSQTERVADAQILDVTLFSNGSHLCMRPTCGTGNAVASPTRDELSLLDTVELSIGNEVSVFTYAELLAIASDFHERAVLRELAYAVFYAHIASLLCRELMECEHCALRERRLMLSISLSGDLTILGFFGTNGFAQSVFQPE